MLQCDDFYHPNDESGVAWNDLEIGIIWMRVEGACKGIASAEGYCLDKAELNLSDEDQKWLGIKNSNVFN